MNYILFGEEDFLIKQRVNKLVKSFFDKEEKNIYKSDYLTDGLNDFISALEQVDFLFSSKKCIILDNADFLSEEKERKKIDKFINDKLLGLLKDDNDEILTIFITHKATKNGTLLARSEIVKLIEKKGKIYSFPAIKKNDFLSYIRKYFEMHGYEIDESAIKLMSENVGSDLYLFNNEAQKLMPYVDKKIITKEDVEAICSVNIDDNMFDLSNAFLAKDNKKVFKIYNDLTIRGIEPVVLIAFLTTNFISYDKILYLSLSGYSNEEIATSLKMHPYAVQISLRGLRNYTLDEIENILNKLYELDKNIKLGNVDRFFAFESFLLYL